MASPCGAEMSRFKIVSLFLTMIVAGCGARDGLGGGGHEGLDAAPVLPQDASVDDAGPEVVPPEPRSSCLPECQAPAFRDAHPALCDCPEYHDAGGCWRCTDRAWRNVCVTPAELGTDALSCLMCGEHCDSTADAGGE